MLAAVLHQAKSKLTIQDVELDPPGPGEVLVKVEAAGICHTDQHYISGDLSCLLPAVVGHEGAGRIESVGPGVTRFEAGQRVCMTWRPRCGECHFCVTGYPAMCERAVVQSRFGGLLDGTSRLHGGGSTIHHLLGVSCFAQYAVVSERAVVAVPDDIPSEIAAIAGCAVITGVGAVLNVIGACAGRSIAIFGAGGVGLSAVMGAKLSGANPIIVVDVVADRLAAARTLGATAVINAGESDVGPELASLVPEGLDFAIEAVGRGDTLAAAFACLRPRGTMVAVGLGHQDAVVPVPLNQLVQREKRVVGSLYGSSNPVVDLPRLFDLYRAGRLPLDLLLGQRYRLDEVNQAYADLASGVVGRGVLLPWSI
ncbi:S-(hydroxymethyl)glutathione dehydrogenase / alcohol dehydrogenase [Nakamurella panacisegetis]|uniref:S-(Hydroxymethyl)glutathione dehydrogenase / alcohol dehydrogenase n=1 Tax=Nakamurella panacisegetis TaxID=1090615 RepID=A0A1H0R8B5_9ACTN|nr:Zn-dependent alcohol dehydrogenase [Nakamurella panacisegetis]SDP25772.1 S-(hydroxymethyl)glutathione dehydrogenase / alcohol dehydrogenase [Nakamurella panacisegetis]